MVDRVTQTVEVRVALVYGHPFKHVGVSLGSGGKGLVGRATIGRTQKIDVGTQLHVSLAIGETRGGTVGVGNVRVAVLVHFVGKPRESLRRGNNVGARFGTRTRKRFEVGCARHIRGAQRSFILLGTNNRPIGVVAAGKEGEPAVRAVGTHPLVVFEVDARCRGGTGGQRRVERSHERVNLHVDSSHGCCCTGA